MKTSDDLLADMHWADGPATRLACDAYVVYESTKLSAAYRSLYVRARSPMLGRAAQIFFVELLLADHCDADAAEIVSRWQAAPIGDQEDYHQLGMALERRLPELALEVHRRLVREHPESYYWHFSVGRVLADAGRLEEAIQCYQEAVRLAPDEPNMWLNLGNLYADIGDDSACLAAYRKALDVCPGHLVVILNMGAHLSAAGRVDDALSLYKSGLNAAHGIVTGSDEDPWGSNRAAVRYRIGEIYRDAGDLAAAAGWFADALLLDPADEDFRTALSEATKGGNL